MYTRRRRRRFTSTHLDVSSFGFSVAFRAGGGGGGDIGDQIRSFGQLGYVCALSERLRVWAVCSTRMKSLENR